MKEPGQEPRPVRRTVVRFEFDWSKYGGDSLYMVLSCGHTVLRSRPPRHAPKTTICPKCTRGDEPAKLH